MQLPLDNTLNRILKRTIDILFSLFVTILILSWFIPFMALLIKLTSRGPVFFVQPRTGKHNTTFNCYKLRTMKLNSTAHTQQALVDDERITIVGKFLRKFSLDELPQFINVLKGEMSVIGPRPHMLYHTESYSKVVDQYFMRLNAKPGITGLSQVLGYRGEIKDSLMIKNRVRLDIFYINKWSMFLDLKIALKTIKLILFG